MLPNNTSPYRNVSENSSMNTDQIEVLEDLYPLTIAYLLIIDLKKTNKKSASGNRGGGLEIFLSACQSSWLKSSFKPVFPKYGCAFG